MDKDLQREIDNFLKTTNLKTAVKSELVLGIAGDALVKNAAENGIDINGFSHSIDNFFVNHALNSHGDVDIEKNRGNISITEEDIKNIPNILQSPDFLIYGSKTKTGNNAIVFAKNINGSTIFVEEVRNGKRKLAAQTIYKLPRTIDVSFIKNAPELYAHSDPGTMKIVDVKNDIVKGMFIKSDNENTVNSYTQELERKLEEANRTIQSQNTTIQTQKRLLKEQDQILHGKTTIVVNGIERTINNGLENGMKEAVMRLDKQIQLNQKLSEELSKSKSNNIPPKSPSDDEWDR